MTVYKGLTWETHRQEVCDHVGTVEAISTDEVEGVRCTECECAWWRKKNAPYLPDPQWLSPYVRIVQIEASP